MQLKLKGNIGRWSFGFGVRTAPTPVVAPRARAGNLLPASKCDEGMDHDFTHWTNPEQKEIEMVASFIGTGGSRTATLQSRTCTRCNIYEQRIAG